MSTRPITIPRRARRALLLASPLLLTMTGCSSLPTMTPIETGAVRPAAGPTGNGPRLAERPATVAAGRTDVTRAKHVSSGKPVRIHTLVSFDKACNPLTPQITIDRQPAKGAVGFETGKATTVQYSTSGNCVGRTMPGTIVTYTANAGTTGADSFSITARSASGEIGSKAFDVVIVD